MAKSKYEEMDIETRLPEIEQMARDGYRDEDIAKTLGITRQTLYAWKGKYEDFAEALRKGKAVVDAEIENKLLDNARGYTYWEETQELVKELNPMTGRVEEFLKTVKRVKKHVKGDTTAQIFWLKNRKPDQWRDKQHIQHSGGIGVNGLDYMSDDEIEKELGKLKDE
jgi:transposase-like protein